MRSADLKLLTWLLPEMYSIQSYHYSRVVKSSRLPVKLATYLVLAATLLGISLTDGNF